MHPIWWTILGLLIGLVAMLPVIRALLRRAEYRARLAERRARDAERLAELGAMTSGLAHEIKNPLSTVSLNAQLLMEGLVDSKLPEDERHRLLRRLEALSREVNRLRGILEDFLTFAGRMKLDPQSHDLVRIVDELSDFFHPQCDQAGVTLRTQLHEQPISVPVDEGLLKQAILNLMINAVQAMSNTRTISHDTSSQTTSITPPRELILRVETDTKEARVHVIDTGPGIDADKMSDIFHPYVSHKPRGSGLGLPTARRIIEEHGGRLVVHSEVGRGSDFVIHLPIENPGIDDQQ